jgi:hypothetical protein
MTSVRNLKPRPAIEVPQEDLLSRRDEGLRFGYGSLRGRYVFYVHLTTKTLLAVMLDQSHRMDGKGPDRPQDQDIAA